MSHSLIKDVPRVILAIVVASCAGYFAHSYFGEWIGSWLNTAMLESGIDDPARAYRVFVWTAVSTVIPVTAMILLLDAFSTRFEFESPVAKGTVFALLILALQGDLIRKPLIYFLNGSTLRGVIAEFSGVWLANICICLIIALILHKPKEKNHE